MARYIDADVLKKRLGEIGYEANDLYAMGINRGLDRAETAVDMIPTADVVPKSEVAILSFQNAALRDSSGILHKALAEAESRVASEIFDVVDELIDRICAMTGVNIILFGKYVELKKKYGVGGAGEGDE